MVDQLEKAVEEQEILEPLHRQQDEAQVRARSYSGSQRHGPCNSCRSPMSQQGCSCCAHVGAGEGGVCMHTCMRCTRAGLGGERPQPRRPHQSSGCHLGLRRLPRNDRGSACLRGLVPRFGRGRALCTRPPIFQHMHTRLAAHPREQEPATCVHYLSAFSEASQALNATSNQINKHKLVVTCVSWSCTGQTIAASYGR